MSIELEREAKTVYFVYDHIGIVHECKTLKEARNLFKEADKGHGDCAIEKVWAETTTLTKREIIKAAKN